MIINKKIIAREIQSETVLLNKENGDYFSLTSVGTEIYNCISKGMETEAIISFLSTKYNVEYDTLKNDVTSLISEMQEKNILIKKQ
jgi:hypothetical protein